MGMVTDHCIGTGLCHFFKGIHDIGRSKRDIFQAAMGNDNNQINFLFKGFNPGFEPWNLPAHDPWANACCCLVFSFTEIDNGNFNAIGCQDQGFSSFIKGVSSSGPLNLVFIKSLNGVLECRKTKVKDMVVGQGYCINGNSCQPLYML